MGKYQYDIIDGQRVEKNIAVQYRKMAAEFLKDTGCHLYVTSGVRTEAEQAKGRADYVAGRTKTKWAIPTESSHCEVGPAGPRALDLRDSGKDPGVTVKGTRRWNILKRIAAKYGFTWGGWGVPDNEGWHWENHKVKVGVYGVVGKIAAAVHGYPASDMLKWKWTGIQRMLKADFGYTGRIDNIPGNGTKIANRRFLTNKGYSKRANGWGLALTPTFNKNDVKAIQQWLKDTGRDRSLVVDGKPGPKTKIAWLKAEAENGRAYSWVK